MENVRVTVSPWPEHRPFGASITFDGGYTNALDVALPVLRARAVPSTWYLVAGAVGGTLEERGVPAWDRWREEIGGGLVEVGNHTLTHPLVRRSPSQHLAWLASPRRLRRRITRVASGLPRVHQTHSTAYDPVGRLTSPRGLIADALQGQAVLEWQLGRPVRTFAYPNGRANPGVSRALAHRGTIACRTTDPGTHDPGAPLHAVPAHLFTVETTPEEASTWVAEARTAGGWYVDVHHLVTEDTSYMWSTHPSLLEHQLDALESAGAWFGTVAEVAAQLMRVRSMSIEAAVQGSTVHITKHGGPAVTITAHIGREFVPLELPAGVKRGDGVVAWAAPAGDQVLELRS